MRSGVGVEDPGYHGGVPVIPQEVLDAQDIRATAAQVLVRELRPRMRACQRGIAHTGEQHGRGEERGKGGALARHEARPSGR